VEAIERRRQEYLQLQSLVEHFVVVDVTQPEEIVASQVKELVQNFYLLKRRSIPQAQHS
jgi:hypothetical protein